MAAVDWKLYEQLLGNVRKGAADEAVESFMDGILDNPAYREDVTVEGVQTPMVISRTSTTECSIKAFPGTSIHIGDLVQHCREYWIVVELYTDKIGLINGKMWLCNDVIRFQNGSSYIHVRHCIVDDGAYSKKSSDPDAFVMENTYKMYLPIDDASKRLFVDKRLALGRIFSSTGEEILEVYKVIGIDVKSKNFGEGSHLMTLTVQRDVYNPHTDNLSENICDEYKGQEITETPSESGRCIIMGRDSIRIGTARKYTANYVNLNGETILNVGTMWGFTASPQITYATSGNECTLTVPLDESLVGSEIIIHASDISGTHGLCEKKVQVIAIG